MTESAAQAAPRVAVIGAGVAGLRCARVLSDAGIAVRLFDKGWRVGGRLATRRIEGLGFDHGAQFIRGRTPALAGGIAKSSARQS
ncbi:MAG: NAD(P)-binding protein, partial [Polyangiales bacterium]